MKPVIIPHANRAQVANATGARCPYKTRMGYRCGLPEGHEKRGKKQHRIAYSGKVG